MNIIKVYQTLFLKTIIFFNLKLMVWGIFFVPYFYKKENYQDYVNIVKKTNRIEEFSEFYFFHFSLLNQQTTFFILHHWVNMHWPQITEFSYLFVTFLLWQIIDGYMRIKLSISSSSFISPCILNFWYLYYYSVCDFVTILKSCIFI